MYHLSLYHYHQIANILKDKVGGPAPPQKPLNPLKGHGRVLKPDSQAAPPYNVVLKNVPTPNTPVTPASLPPPPAPQVCGSLKNRTNIIFDF